MGGYKSGKPPGAPRKEIDLDVAERAASIGCQMEEIAAMLGVGKQCLYDRLKDTPELVEVIDRGRAKGRGTLRRLQWQHANGGSDTMLIWLGKNLLGQTDKFEHGGAEGGPIKHIFSWDTVKPFVPPEPPSDE
jgi:hypothetical protein